MSKMKKLLEKTNERDKLLARLMDISYSSLCDPECWGRCGDCPADVVQDAIKFIESVPTTHTVGPKLGADTLKEYHETE